MQVWLPAGMKAKLVRQVLVRRKAVYVGASHLSRWGILIPEPLSPSQYRQRYFIRKEKENRTKRLRGREWGRLRVLH